MGADTAAAQLAALTADRVDHRFKGLPPDAEGLTVGELAAQRRNLFTDGFTTPVLALSAERLEHNLALMETYATRHGLVFAPHGKTSMAPQLFWKQIEHGAWGITLAVPHQVRVARSSASTGSSSRTNSSTHRPCATSPPTWRRTRTSASSVTSTPYAAWS